MTRAGIVIVAIFGAGVGWVATAVLPDWVTWLGITNVSHYPPVVVAVSTLAGAAALGVIAWSWRADR